MRPAVALLALLIGGGAAHAQNKIAEFLPGTPGQKACFARTYDARHLREHPKQRVTSMTFLMRVVGISDSGDWVLDPKEKYDRLSYQFAMDVQRRGEKKARTVSGYCPEDSKDTMCARECDGGGVFVEKRDDALIVRLDQWGIRMDSCGEGDGVWLKPGADDKMFRLNKVADAQCKALETEELGP